MSQSFRRRVGALIEKYVCDKYNLLFNKRQRKYGYFDAYNKDGIFEIKATHIKSNRFVIKTENHKKLLKAHGSYVFVVYDLINRDKRLTVITDIDVLKIKIVDAKVIDDVLSVKKIEKYSKFNNNKYQRIRINEVF